MNHFTRADLALILCLLLMVIVGVVAYFRPVAAAALPDEADYAEWSYPIPVEPDTQSGAPFLDRDGRVFSVVRNDAHLQVYRDGTLVLDKREAYGAPFGQIRNDGCLYVSALDATRPRRLWRVYLVPTFKCLTFIAPVEALPMVPR